jgi:hypothetical protein
MLFRFRPNPAWPPLAWLATCTPGVQAVDVEHGPRVECRPEWFAEAVWDGDFESGAFDRTDIVAGTGGRIRGDHVVFVASGTTVDRLHSLRRGQEVFVSNSLACLAEMADAQPWPHYPWYARELETVVKGLGEYRRTLETTGGDVHLRYFDNLHWDGSRLEPFEKPSASRDFSTFHAYRDFLCTALHAVAVNLKDPRRETALDFIGTCSSGYDSATVAALAGEAGCREVLCLMRARDGAPDGGDEIAAALGLVGHQIAPDDWRSGRLPEVPFVAADGSGVDVFLRGAEAHLAGRVLLTGFHGDKVWSKAPGKLDTRLSRGDSSGLSLTEYRLQQGFIHCAVPFWGARQIADLVALSNSRELSAWDVPGPYSRPVCRRILEEAGVPRQAFGIRKRAGAVLLLESENFLTEPSLADYTQWLAGVAPTMPVWRRVLARSTRVDRLLWRLPASLERLGRRGGAFRAANGVRRPVVRFARAIPTARSYVFAWAVQRARSDYARATALRD